LESKGLRITRVYSNYISPALLWCKKINLFRKLKIVITKGIAAKKKNAGPSVNQG
jgi:hypothetical protein